MAARRFRRSLVVLALGVLSVGLAFATFEGVLALLELGKPGVDAWRIGGYHQPDERLIYFPIPGATKVYRTPEFTEEVRINSIGLRDDELAERGAFDRRIVVVGDSMTFGHGVAADEAYPNALEALYRAQGRRVDVVNAGVKGYGFDQCHALFVERLRSLDPDVLVFAFYLNDVIDNLMHPLFRLEAGRAAPDAGRLVPVDARRDPLYRVGAIHARLPGLLRRTRVARWCTQRLVDSAEQPTGRGLRLRLEEERRKLALELESLARIGASDGFAIVVLGLPHRDGPPGGYPWLPGVCRNRARLLDLSADPSWQAQKEKRFYRIDDHLTAAGHRRVAEQLLEFLEREGL